MNMDIAERVARIDHQMQRIADILEVGDVTHEQFIHATHIATALVILKAQLTSRGESK